MATRILKYLDKLDLLREQTDHKVDETLKGIDVKVLLKNPDEAMKLIALKIIKDNSGLFKQARIEGQELAKSL